MADLTGKRVLVAGGTGNVGRYIVDSALAAGGTVIVPSRSADRLRAIMGGRAPEQRERLLPLVGDLADERKAASLVEQAGHLDGAVASLGHFVAAPRILAAPVADLQRVLDDYVKAHFAVARALIPTLEARGGSYVSINGPLAFDPLFPGTGLVSVATAAQAMLAHVLFKELADSRVRVNEVVIYSSFGRGNDEGNEIGGDDVGRYVAHLLSDRGVGVRGKTIHLRSKEVLNDLSQR